MEQVIIKQATSDDVVSLQMIARQTFIEAFAGDNTEEDLQTYLADSFSDEHLRDELNNPNSLFYIAWSNLAPVGYLKVNFVEAQTELQERDSMEIQRIYVKSDYYGKRVGKLLYDQALNIAQTHGKSSIWLGVWEKNSRAIRFYEKNGFVTFDRRIFKLGNDKQMDIMMRKSL